MSQPSGGISARGPRSSSRRRASEAPSLRSEMTVDVPRPAASESVAIGWHIALPDLRSRNICIAPKLPCFAFGNSIKPAPAYGKERWPQLKDWVDLEVFRPPWVHVSISNRKGDEGRRKFEGPGRIQQVVGALAGETSSRVEGRRQHPAMRRSRERQIAHLAVRDLPRYSAIPADGGTQPSNAALLSPGCFSPCRSPHDPRWLRSAAAPVLAWWSHPIEEAFSPSALGQSIGLRPIALRPVRPQLLPVASPATGANYAASRVAHGPACQGIALRESWPSQGPRAGRIQAHTPSPSPERLGGPLPHRRRRSAALPPDGP